MSAHSHGSLTRKGVFLALFVVLGAVAAEAAAQEVRYVEENGVTYRETRRTGYQTICRTEMRPTERIIYREQCETQSREVTRTWWTPVTDCRWEAQWVGRWNPFAQPYLAYRPVQRTRWEQRTETVQVPVTVRRLVPEAQTVQVPVTVRRLVPEEVVTRVAVSSPGVLGPGQGPRPGLASGGPIGGVARLESDPPRQGVSSAWRPSSPMR